MITYKEAVEFLQNILHIDDIDVKLQKNRLDLLTEITSNFTRYVPFHNLTALAVSPQDRCLPNTEAIRSSGLRGEGGLCYPQGVFSKWLLTALGFNSFLIACKIGNIDRPFTHVSTVAKDVVQEGDLYLVELGAGFPTFDPVPLHDLPQTYKHAFLEYKFVRRDDEYFRLHRVGEQLGRLPSAVDEEGWQTFYHFECVPRDEDFLAKFQEKVYTEPGYAAEWHLMGLKMSLYPKGKAVTVSDRTLRIWDETTKAMTTTELPGIDDMKKALEKHFPMLKEVDIEAALKNWKKEADDWKLKKEQKK